VFLCLRGEQVFIGEQEFAALLRAKPSPVERMPIKPAIAGFFAGAGTGWKSAILKNNTARAAARAQTPALAAGVTACGGRGGPCASCCRFCGGGGAWTSGLSFPYYLKLTIFTFSEADKLS